MTSASSVLMYRSLADAIIFSLSESQVSLNVVYVSLVWCHARIASCTSKGSVVVRNVVGFVGSSLSDVGLDHATLFNVQYLM